MKTSAVRIEAVRHKQNARSWIVMAKFLDSEGGNFAPSLELGYYIGAAQARPAMLTEYLSIKESLEKFSDGNLIITFGDLPVDS